MRIYLGNGKVEGGRGGDLVAAHLKKDFPGGTVDGTLPANAGDVGLVPGPGRFHVLWIN